MGFFAPLHGLTYKSSVRFLRGLATIRRKGSNVALPAVTPFAAPKTAPEIPASGPFCLSWLGHCKTLVAV